jgi:hypothetical protein
MPDQANQLFAAVVERRLAAPGFAAEVAASRRRREKTLVSPDGKLFVLAADAPGRGVIGTRGDDTCLARRPDVLARTLVALADPTLDGLIASADLIDDLLILDGLRKERGESSLLDDRVLVGSMNRGGISGAVDELNDTFTGYTVEGMVAGGIDAGKALWRMDLDDPDSSRTLLALAQAAEESARAELPFFFEVFPVTERRPDRTYGIADDRLASIRGVGIASAVASRSTYTWLKLPPSPYLGEMARATTSPIVVLGGESTGAGGLREQVEASLAAAPNVVGCMIGRRLLFPPDDDVAAAVAEIGSVVHPELAATPA